MRITATGTVILISLFFLAGPSSGVLQPPEVENRRPSSSQVDAFAISGDGAKDAVVRRPSDVSVTEHDSSRSISRSVNLNGSNWFASLNHDGTVLAFGRAGKSYLSNNLVWLNTGRFFVWDTRAKDSAPLSFPHNQAIMGVHLNPSGEVLTIVGWWGDLAVRDSASGRLLTRVPGGKSGWVHENFRLSDMEWRTSFSESGRRIVALLMIPGGPHDTPQLTLWDLDAPEQNVRREGGPIRNARSIALSPDGKLFALGFSNESAIEVRSFDNMMLLYTCEGKDKNRTDALAFSTTGERLLAGHGDGDVEVWDTKTGGFVRQLSAEGRAGKIRAMYASDKKIRIARGGLRQEPPPGEAEKPDAKIDPLTIQDVSEP